MAYDIGIPSQVITTLGSITLALLLYRFVSFAWLYYLRPLSLDKFLRGSETYALITGASDGIGRAVAQELYERGFNLILHGRNEAKLKTVIDQIRTTSKGPNRDIKYFIAAANSTGVDFKEIAGRFEDLQITLFINNVGGGGPRAGRIDNHTSEDLHGDIRLNALFPFNLTHAFLPRLRASRRPVEVIFVGSQSADISIPHLFTYAPSKSFIYQLTRCLNADEKVGPPSQIRFTYWNVGTVVTNGLREKPSLFYPLAAKFAKHSLHVIGSGYEKVTPYAPHAVQQFFVELLPKSFLDHHAAKTMEHLLEEAQKRTD